MKTRLSLLLIAATLLCSSFSQALPAGQINFDELSKHYGDAKVEINLSKGLISMVSGLSKQNDPEVSDMLSKLEMVKVRVYNLNGEPEKAKNAVDKVTQLIKKDKWENIVTVNEQHEKVRIFSKANNDKIDGIIVMVVDAQAEQGGEAVFINIVGEIDPANVTRVTQSLNINFDQ